MSEWRENLQRRYGKIDSSRSDPPSSRLHWVYTPRLFLWHKRLFPPMPERTRYIVLENWYVVYDDNEDAFYLWVQRRMLGVGISLEEILRMLPKIVKAQKEKLNANSYIEVRAHVGWTIYPLSDWDRTRRRMGRKRERERERKS